MNKIYLFTLTGLFLASSISAGKDSDPEICTIMKKGNTRDQVIKIIQNTSNLNVTNYLGCTPLVLAIVKQDSKIVDELLKHGADPNLCTKDGVTPISVAKTILKENKNNYEAQKIYSLLKAHEYLRSKK